MKRIFVEGKDFSNQHFTPESLIAGDYEECKFSGCDFTNVSLSEFVFSDCEFVDCNLSLVNITNAAFKDVKFIRSKMLGLHFESCNDVLFSVYFDGCSLNLSSFYRRKMKRTIFKNSSLIETEFTEADLNNATFENCDLSKTVFLNTNLENADFRTSWNYAFDPEQNRIKNAKFSLQGVAGLLDKYNIKIDM